MKTKIEQNRNQEIFDKVAKHLLTQNSKALMNENGRLCAYLNKEGKRCAAGCLITEENYSKDLEGSTMIGDTCNAKGVREAITNSLGYEPDFQFIRELQKIHDNSEVCDWPAKLKNIASFYTLSSKVLDQS